MVDAPALAPVVAPAAPAPSSTPSAPAPAPAAGAAPPAAEAPAPSLTAPPAEAGTESLVAAEAPITYQPFKLPEGVELQPEGLAAVQTLFAELKVPQEGAQKLVDMYVQNVQDTIKATEEAGQKAWNETRREWTSKVFLDPEIGGEKLPATKALVAKFLDTFGTPGVREALTVTGADNNPEVIKTLWKAAKALTEGTHVAGQPAGQSAAKSLAERMYPEGPKQGIQGQPQGTN